MTPQINSIIAVIFLLGGAGAVSIMLELKGLPKDRLRNRRLIFAHRILGYIFVSLYLLMVLIMIVKVGRFQEELTPRGVLHVVMALALLPLLGVKIAIARRYKLMTTRTFGLGISIFVLALVFNLITAGYYFLHSGDIRYTSITAVDADILDEDTGRLFTQRKCNKCHTLERVFRSFKTEDGWAQTVNRMAEIDAPNIRGFEVKQIIHFLVRQQETRKGEEAQQLRKEIGKTLVARKCSICHDLDRVMQAIKTEDEWQATVERMTQHAADPAFLSKSEKGDIVDYLVRRR